MVLEDNIFGIILVGWNRQLMNHGLLLVILIIFWMLLSGLVDLIMYERVVVSFKILFLSMIFEIWDVLGLGLLGEEGVYLRDWAG